MARLAEDNHPPAHRRTTPPRFQFKLKPRFPRGISRLILPHAVSSHRNREGAARPALSPITDQPRHADNGTGVTKITHNTP